MIGNCQGMFTILRDKSIHLCFSMIPFYKSVWFPKELPATTVYLRTKYPVSQNRTWLKALHTNQR